MNDLSNGLFLKKEITYDDTTENNFAIDLWKELKNDYIIKLMKKQYCNVDIKIINKKTLRFCYIELKCRNIKFLNYDTFIMGSTKIKKMNELNLLPTIMIWKFNEDNIYFTQYINDYLNYPIKFINGSGIIEIKKNQTLNGFNNLINLIKNLC
jgi:hypothetical protein